MEVLVYAKDITERKRAEEALRESEETYRSLLTSLNAGVVVHAPDTSILLANPMACSLLGLSQNQLLGKEAIDPYWRFLRDDGSDMPLDEYPVNQVLASASPLRNRVVGVQRSKADDVVWVLVNGFAAINDAHQIEQVIISFVDITERKRAEEALRESEEKYRALVENATDFIYLLDRENRVLAVNLAGIEVLGKKLDEITGRSVFELFPQEIAQQFSSELKAVFESGKPRFSETKMVAGGRELWMSVNLSPVRNQAGEVESVMGMSRDITERKQTEEILRRSHEELEQRVQARTAELQQFVDLTAGREIRMAGLKNVIKQLRAQLQSAGMVPVADDPLAAGME